MSAPSCPPSFDPGPCQPYVPLDEDLICPCAAIDVNVPEQLEMWELMVLHASKRTWLATDGRFTGCCTATIRPCPKRCAPRVGLDAPPMGLGVPAWPAVVQAQPYPLFVNCWACTCRTSECSCAALEEIRLPWLPVRDVLEVKIDGVVVDPSAYRVLPGTNRLVRIDGGRWPTCQSQALEDTETGTWSITFRHGMDLPSEAVPLVAGYACELVKLCRGQDCGLPDGVRVIQRPGVTYAVIDPQKYREAGLTGYSPLDDWIMQLRGGHARERPRLWSHRSRQTAMRG